jgi:hypothetical protein
VLSTNAGQHIYALVARYPALIADNRRMQAIGLEKWLGEQPQRACRGFIYTDIR